MSGAVAALGPGLHIWHDGVLFQVVELSGRRVLLQSLADAADRRQVETGWLLAHPSTRVVAADVGEPGVGAVLAAAGAEQDVALAAQVGHVREVLTGFRSGSAELAAAGEPRAEYAPGVGRMDRYAAKAAELGVSVMTVRRWVAAFDAQGPAGLVASLRLRDPLGRADPRWLDMCRTVLAEHVAASRPTRAVILMKIAARLEAEYGPDVVPLPGRARGYELLAELSRGSNAFTGSTRGKRSIANRPAGVYSRLRATRPGEYVLLDTTRLDVFAMEPVTCRWVRVELTVAMDLYSRCITGLRCSPVSTKAVDVAAVLFETVHQRRPGQGADPLPFAGVPEAVVVDARKLADSQGRMLLPSVAAETIVYDHGKIYLSHHIESVCARLGVSLQPARPYQATDKSALERWFRTVSESLLVALPGYKGADVHSRGQDVEDQAFYFLDELESIIREWIGIYHRSVHEGLVVPEVPGVEMCPLDMFEHGVRRAGSLRIPGRSDLAFDFLPVTHTTIQHYGVEIDTLRYNGAALNGYRNRVSPYGGVFAGLWPVAVDPDDIRQVWFQDPADPEERWQPLEWEHAAALGRPLSGEAMGYVRHLAVTEQRFPDKNRALVELLRRWDAGLTANPAERRMAVRLATVRKPLFDAEAEAVSALPSVARIAALSAGGGPVGQDTDGEATGAQPVGGDDDEDGELDAPLRSSSADAAGGADDEGFYYDVLECG